LVVGVLAQRDFFKYDVGDVIGERRALTINKEQDILSIIED